MKFLTIILTIIVIFVLSGCSLVRQGITGEGPEAATTPVSVEPVEVVPAAFPIIGDWFGVYDKNEYVAVKFSEDGKCELQTAVYPSDMYGPKYYGTYTWGGDSGKEVILDMYRGQSKTITNEDGLVFDEWYDSGRENATTALMLTLRIYGGPMKTFAIKAVGSGTDTEGYAVIQANAFALMLANAADGSSNSSPYLFGTVPFDTEEDKSPNSVVPDTFLDRAERLYINADELNVRCGPSTEYKSYGKIPMGTPVDKIGERSGEEDWIFVLLMDGGGWVNKDYLVETNPTTAQPETPNEEESN